MHNNTIFVITSWDDVTKLDIKVSDILDSYGFKGSFYPVYNWIDKKISRDELIHISEVHEIGSHTINHVNLKSIPLEVAKREIIDSKKLLEEILEKDITSFVYPMGIYNNSHVEIVKEANYVCARTTKPFYVESADNPYEINVTIWTYPHAFRDLKAMARLFALYPNFILSPWIIKKWDILGKRIFEFLLESGGVFHFFGHAWQIDEKDGWKDLENFLAYLAFRKNVSYLTLTEYAKLRFYTIE